MFPYRLAGCVALVSAAVSAVVLTGCHRTPEDKAAMVTEHVADSLDLDKAQEGRLVKVSDEVLVLIKELQKERARDLLELAAQVGSEQLDREKLLAMYKARREAFDQRVPAIVDQLVEFHKSLNTEQKTELAQHLRKFHERRFK
jgi:Spy/CpxP family protein refolding chaperone